MVFGRSAPGQGLLPSIPSAVGETNRSPTMDVDHKEEYHVRDLATRSVTLFPARAQIAREIKDVSLKPGTNEIVVVGLTPTLDEDSVKVEGTGSAVISNIAVELVPNRDIFQDIHPEFDSDVSDNESDSDKEESDSDPFNKAPSDSEEEDPELTRIQDALQELRDEKKRSAEIISSAEARLKILDAYSKQLDDKKRVVDIAEGIETYRTEREKVFQAHMEGAAKDRELSRKIAKLIREERRIVSKKQAEERKAAKVKTKARQIRLKEEEKENRRKAEKRRERHRLRKECEKFWPRLCYTVRITLEASSFTPSSSRRNSVSSDVDIAKPLSPSSPSTEAVDETGGLQCDLLLSYVTSSAFWSPSYDLQLSTTTNTALLCFDAQLTNATSETWSGCKVTLSTSQATFAGLQDTIPNLKPWRIKLAPKGSHAAATYITDSNEERNRKIMWEDGQRKSALQRTRQGLFGVDPAIASNNLFCGGLKNTSGGGGLFGQTNNPNANNSNAPSSGLFGPSANVARPSGGGLFGGSVAQPAQNSASFAASSNIDNSNVTSAFAGQPPPPPSAPAPAPAPAAAPRGGGGLFGTLGAPSRSAPAAEDSEGAQGDFGDDNTILEPQPELEFQESAIEETGLTTTYDLPGLKTLAPRSTASKQRVARFTLHNVAFSHTIVAKYKPVAFLKARFRNSSKLTLLRGAAGLTLDGSFMGRTTLPRCSSGDNYTLSLGVDPAIKVSYPKPEVRRATSGLFSKEDSSVYTRTVAISNTRSSGKATNLYVLDQIPVSEDERLKVEVLQPRGMTIAGAGVAAGVPGREGRESKEWGKASATLKKAGEVSWDVTLLPGKSVKLGLDYVVAMPSGDHAVECL